MLGATRDEEGTEDGAVLGARRGGTDDYTNMTGRLIAVLIAAAVAVSLMIAGKKKKEEE